MTNENNNIEKTTETAKKKITATGLVGKLLMSAAVPCTAPFMLNFPEKIKAYSAAAILVVGFGYNIHTTGILNSDLETVQRTDIKNVPMLEGEKFVTTQKTNWDYHMDNNVKEKSLMRFVDFGALFLSPGYMAYNSSDEFFDESLKEKSNSNKYKFEAGFSTKGAGYTTGGKSDEPFCELRIDGVKKDWDFVPKAFHAKNYELSTSNEICEHAWGKKVNKMGTESFGWAKEKLENQLLAVRETPSYKRARLQATMKRMDSLSESLKKKKNN